MTYSRVKWRHSISQDALNLEKDDKIKPNSSGNSKKDKSYIELYRVLCEAFNLIGKELTTSSANVTVKVQQVRSSGYTLVSGTLIGLFLVAILIGVATVVVLRGLLFFENFYD
ncbi:hypothetical protein HELRODRAFT_166171 [Helobdella robusta]|uniref:Uncharacterized protein n=1 Tax=Helobdella robusta TaxID=6412 RepID=T1EXV2_HELRO|nr:hypothetical protein HELRODRAFT_166171 [Helobdella robusta]ESN90500.1 hypothetical protein HELRODRAFT_166171 [Helobdella robusta]